MKSDQNPFRMLALVSALGIDLAIFILAGVYGGRWFDVRFETEPIGLMVGLVLGLAFGFYSAAMMIKRYL